MSSQLLLLDPIESPADSFIPDGYIIEPYYLQERRFKAWLRDLVGRYPQVPAPLPDQHRLVPVPVTVQSNRVWLNCPSTPSMPRTGWQAFRMGRPPPPSSTMGTAAASGVSVWATY